MLLMSVSAFAQSNEPLYGDVNYDGVVDVGDINAIIAIIKNYAATQTTYYWYVSQTKPTASTTLPTSDSQCAADGEQGWHKIGNDYALNSFVYDFDSNRMSILDPPQTYYLILPSSINVYAGGSNVNNNYFDTLDTPSITGYKVFQYADTTYYIQGIQIRK